jgi:hypothetical protein
VGTAYPGKLSASIESAELLGFAMITHQGCDDCRRWLREEAEGLPEVSRQKVLHALDEKHDRICCTRLMDLKEEGEIPAFWSATLDRFW